jgi:hypothetical protein
MRRKDRDASEGKENCRIVVELLEEAKETARPVNTAGNRDQGVAKSGQSL